MKESKRHASEIKLFLLLIPLINVFNYYLTYNNISVSWRTLLTFSIDTLLGYAAWAAVHFIIIYLDQRLPFHENVLKRLTIQIVTTLFSRHVHYRRFNGYHPLCTRRWPHAR